MQAVRKNLIVIQTYGMITQEGVEAEALGKHRASVRPKAKRSAGKHRPLVHEVVFQGAPVNDSDAAVHVLELRSRDGSGRSQASLSLLQGEFTNKRKLEAG